MRCRPRAGWRAWPGRGYRACTRAPGGQPAPPAPPRSPTPGTGLCSHYSLHGLSCHLSRVTRVSRGPFSVSCDFPCPGCCCRGAAGPSVCWPAPAQCHVMSCHVMSCHVTMSPAAGEVGHTPARRGRCPSSPILRLSQTEIGCRGRVQSGEYLMVNVQHTIHWQ